MARKYINNEIEWLKMRSTRVTATEVAALFGLNPYSSANQVAANKKAPIEVLNNGYILLGQWLESAVISIANHYLKRDFKNPNENGKLFCIHDTLDLGATPDAEDEEAFLECKTTGARNLIKWAYTPPLHYLLQLHTQMICGNKEVGYLCCVSTNFTQTSPTLTLDLTIYRATRDPEITRMIETEVTKFWRYFNEGKTLRVQSATKTKMSWLLKLNCEKIEV